MSATVALVSSLDSPALLEALVRCMPVWIADTEAHQAMVAASEARGASLALTWFPLRAGESAAAAALRICPSLDDHHNELAQAVGYQALMVFGVPCRDDLLACLAPLGFSRVEAAPFGFTAVK